jgi:hypothetical protein
MEETGGGQILGILVFWSFGHGLFLVIGVLVSLDAVCIPVTPETVLKFILGRGGGHFLGLRGRIWG